MNLRRGYIIILDQLKKLIIKKKYVSILRSWLEINLNNVCKGIQRKDFEFHQKKEE